MSFFYPSIDPKTIKSLVTIAQLAGEHPSYFLQSPYGSEVEELIKRLNSTTSKAIFTNSDPTAPTSADPYQGLSIELEVIYADLKSSKPSSDEEKLTYIKVASGLLERLLGLKERALNVKAISDFQKGVMEIMEDTFTPSQRTEVMEKLRTLTHEGTAV